MFCCTMNRTMKWLVLRLLVTTDFGGDSICTLHGDRTSPGGSGKTFAVTGGAQRFSAGIPRLFDEDWMICWSTNSLRTVKSPYFIGKSSCLSFLVYINGPWFP